MSGGRFHGQGKERDLMDEERNKIINDPREREREK